ncbi:MAG: DNA repair protein RadC [Candidatus Aenigmatarchaeota archaeon]
MDYRIKDMPEEERPREKLEEKGASSLTGVELLSLVIRSGTSGKNVRQLSAEILSSYSLEGLAERSLEDLKQFRGVSDVKAGQLVAVGELARRMQVEEKEKIESLSDVKLLVEDMKFMEQEQVRVFFLSAGNELLGKIEFDGDVSSAGFSTQKIFKKALSRNAAALIICHNHPSGNPEPTKTDIETTKSLVDAGKNLGVNVLDHIIIGRDVASMRADTELGF